MLGGEIGVDIADSSFTHDFGTERRSHCAPTGLELVDLAEAYDHDTDKPVPIDFDHSLFASKVNALC